MFPVVSSASLCFICIYEIINLQEASMTTPSTLSRESLAGFKLHTRAVNVSESVFA